MAPFSPSSFAPVRTWLMSGATNHGTPRCMAICLGRLLVKQRLPPCNRTEQKVVVDCSSLLKCVSCLCRHM